MSFKKKRTPDAKEMAQKDYRENQRKCIANKLADEGYGEEELEARGLPSPSDDSSSGSES